ncbi:MAG: electron transfer flavoprotein subunit alpha/FixB family protein [Bacteroidia bacterium]|nr:electron transfer flavoprotein subunit alpha/FixB family protein [Bacteroidia bacterium]
MKIIVFTEHENGILKKSGKEAISYARDIANNTNAQIIAITINNSSINTTEFGNCGATSVYSINGSNLNNYSTEAYTECVSNIVNDENPSYIIFANTYTAKSIAPRIAIKTKSGIVSGVISLPSSENTVKKSAFSNKAFSYVKLATNRNVLCITPNSYEIKNFESNSSIVEKTINIDSSAIHTKSINVKKEGGKVSLTEAELVISGGRGMKGPENWYMIEELAELLGAATACSKPVSDMDWRPHSEHVGQTGLTIKANLYIAIGISGAIQHLAGVSSSKVICVINKDPEAPFFKAADYGIVGDAFDILPKLIERAKQLKN